MSQKLESKDWYYYKSIKIPHEWNIKLFGEVVAKLENGYSYKENTELNYANGLPITRIETIADGFIDPKKVGYIKKTNQKRCKTMLQDDILFSHINSLKHVGKIAIYDNNPPVLIHGMNLLRIIANHKILAKYLFYFLKFNPTRDRIRSISQQAVNQVSINTSDLKLFLKIILPTLNEQQKIASILCSVDALIESTGNIIEKTERLKKGLMQQLLTRGIGHTKFKKIKWLFGKYVEIPEEWKIKQFKDISKINPEKINKEYTNKNILYVDIGSIDKFQIVSYDTFTLNNRPSRAQRIIKNNDVIVSTVRPYLKAFSKIKNNKPNMICSTGFTVIRTNIIENNELIFQFIQTKLFEIYMICQMEGLAYPAVTSKVIANSLMPYPIEEKERQKIASILSGVDAYIQKTRQKVKALKNKSINVLLANKILVGV